MDVTILFLIQLFGAFVDWAHIGNAASFELPHLKQQGFLPVTQLSSASDWLNSKLLNIESLDRGLRYSDLSFFFFKPCCKHVN